jgi:hypothetical protein
MSYTPAADLEFSAAAYTPDPAIDFREPGVEISCDQSWTLDAFAFADLTAGASWTIDGVTIADAPFDALWAIVGELPDQIPADFAWGVDAPTIADGIADQAWTLDAFAFADLTAGAAWALAAVDSSGDLSPDQAWTLDAYAIADYVVGAAWALDAPTFGDHVAAAAWDVDGTAIADGVADQRWALAVLSWADRVTGSAWAFDAPIIANGTANQRWAVAVASFADRVGSGKWSLIAPTMADRVGNVHWRISAYAMTDRPANGRWALTAPTYADRPVVQQWAHPGATIRDCVVWHGWALTAPIYQGRAANQRWAVPAAGWGDYPANQRWTLGAYAVADRAFSGRWRLDVTAYADRPADGRWAVDVPAHVIDVVAPWAWAIQTMTVRDVVLGFRHTQTGATDGLATYDAAWAIEIPDWAEFDGSWSYLTIAPEWGDCPGDQWWGLDTLNGGDIVQWQLWAQRGSAVWTPVITATTYTLTLTGAADGVDDIVLPMASFSTRLSRDGSSYLQVSVPNGRRYAADIAARSRGDLVISRGDRYTDDRLDVVEIARATVAQVMPSYGGRASSVSVQGRRDPIATTPRSVIVAGVSSWSISGGKNRWRARINNDLRPGDTAVVDGRSAVIGEIVHNVNAANAYMDIAEA